MYILPITKNLPTKYPSPQHEKSKHIESIFSGVACFLDYFSGNSSGFDQETKLYFKQLMQIWTLYEKDFITKKLLFSHWNFSGVRPANYPYRRLAVMSHFLSKNLDRDLMAKIYPAISVWSEDSPEKKKRDYIIKLFLEPENNFCSFRYSPCGKKLSSPKRLIGKERIWDMVVNIFLPALLYFGKQKKSHSMEKILYQVYNHFPRLSPNRITKFMEEFILGLVKNK